MKKNKFIIHIGPHKTGSTYIQKTLYENRLKLKEAGIEYGNIRNKKHIAHHELAEKLFLRKFEESSILIEEIKKEYKKDIFISSENFDRLDNESIVKLQEFISDYNVEIIFFKRRLDDLLVSNWQEDIKHGGIQSWDNYFYHHIIKPYQSSVLNMDKILDRYSTVFGISHIKIIDFDCAKESSVDICDLIFNCLSYPSLTGLGQRKSINQSMNYTDIELIRLLNIKYRKKYKRNPHHFLRESYIKYINSKSNKIGLEILKVINQNLEEVFLNNTFVFSLLNKSFINQYKKSIYNYSINKNIEKAYSLPTREWYIEKDIIEKIDKLFIIIEKDIKFNNNHPIKL